MCPGIERNIGLFYLVGIEERRGGGIYLEEVTQQSTTNNTIDPIRGHAAAVSADPCAKYDRTHTNYTLNNINNYDVPNKKTSNGNKKMKRKEDK